MPSGYARSTYDRVSSNIEPVDRGYDTKCFIWLGEKDRSGYGRVKHKSRYVPAHWVLFAAVSYGKAYADRIGYSPPGDYEVDHLCKQRDCVRPSHLEYVTRKENMQRMHEDRNNG